MHSVIDRVSDVYKLAFLFTMKADFVWHPSATMPDIQIFTHCRSARGEQDGGDMSE